MKTKEIYMSKPWVKFYPEGAAATVDIPEGMSAPDMFENAVSLYGKKPALIFYGREISYNELKELIDRFATALAEVHSTCKCTR